MSTIIFDENTVTGHLTITDQSVTYRHHAGIQLIEDSVARAAITGVSVKRGISLLGMHGAMKIRIHRTGGKDLVIQSIGHHAGERVLALLH